MLGTMVQSPAELGVSLLPCLACLADLLRFLDEDDERMMLRKMAMVMIMMSMVMMIAVTS